LSCLISFLLDWNSLLSETDNIGGMRPLNYEGYADVTSNKTIILNANLGDRLQPTEVIFRAFTL